MRPSLTLAVAFLAALANAQAKRPPRTYDLQHVKWKLSFETRTGSIVGDVVNTVKPLKNGLTSVRLDAGPMEITRVEAWWKPTTFKREGDSIVIKLPRPAKATELVHVRVQYRATPTAGVYIVPDARAHPSKTGMIYTQGEMEDTRYWLPTYDFPDDKATSEGTLVVPPSWNTLSNGKLLDVVASPTQRTWKWKMDQAHSTYLISFVVGRYAEIKEQWNGIPVTSYVPPNLLEEGKASFEGTSKMVAFFSDLTGYRYPFAKFSQSVVADIPFGGMENITAVTNTIGTLHGAADKPLASSDGLVLHELAHQWFGDVITCKSWEHIWINEGFATFLPAFYERETKGDTVFDLARHDLFEGAINQCLGAPVPLVRGYGEPIQMFDGHAYGGGAARLHMLLNVLGEGQFWKSVSALLKENQFKALNTDEVFASLEKSSGKSLKAFKDQWFLTANNPVIRTRLEPGAIVFEQDEPFAWELPVYLPEVNQTLTAKFDGTSYRLALPEGATITRYVVDPEVRWMVRVETPDWSKETLLDLWQGSRNAAAKARLIPKLSAKLSGSEQRTWIMGEARPEVRERIVQACNGLDVQTLLELADEPSPQIRLAALNKLQPHLGAPGVRLLVEKRWSDGPQTAIRSAALSLLLQTSDAEAYALQAWNTPSLHDGIRVQALRHWAGRNPDKARELALAQLATPISEPVRVESVRILSELKDAPGKNEVLLALLKVARERSFQAKMAAIRGLAGNKDARVKVVLEEASKSSLHFVRNAAKVALGAGG